MNKNIKRNEFHKSWSKSNLIFQYRNKTCSLEKLVRKTFFKSECTISSDLLILQIHSTVRKVYCKIYFKVSRIRVNLPN